MITKAEAKRQVEAELQSLKLQRRMTDLQMMVFCQRMAGSLDFRTASSKYRIIRSWVQDWQRAKFA